MNISTLILIILFGFGCSTKVRTDNRLNNITEIQIGSQIWMAENFDGVTFSNGDSIPEAKSAEEWEKAGKARKPAWCNYQNDANIAGKYGRIYNWYALNDPRGLAPRGWHVPTHDEWITLESFLGESDAGQRLRCTTDSLKGDRANIEFCARLGGYRGKEGGFSGFEEFTYMGTSTPRDPKEDDVWGRGIHVANSGVMRCGLFKEHGVYVRLIKD